MGLALLLSLGVCVWLGLLVVLRVCVIDGLPLTLAVDDWLGEVDWLLDWVTLAVPLTEGDCVTVTLAV